MAHSLAPGAPTVPLPTRTMGIMLTVLLGAAGRASVAGPLPVYSNAFEEETTWQPIWRDDVASLLEHSALEELTRGGALQLTPVPTG